MPLFTIGISHHTAPIEIREKVAIPRTEYADRVGQQTVEGQYELFLLRVSQEETVVCFDFDRAGLEIALAPNVI